MADPFSNEPIPTDQLPRLTDDAFVPVDPRYLRVILVPPPADTNARVRSGIGASWRSTGLTLRRVRWRAFPILVAFDPVGHRRLGRLALGS